jgi:hypothetical protein
VTHDEGRAGREAREQVFIEEYAYRLLAGLAILLLATGTIVYRALEDWSWVDSFYFSAVAVTTVGFGDLTPTRDISKLFTVLYIFSGIGIITTFINLRLRRHGSAVSERARKRM